MQVIWAHFFITGDPKASEVLTEMTQISTTLFESAFLVRFLLEENMKGKLAEYIELVKGTKNKHYLVCTYEELIRHYMTKDLLQEACDVVRSAYETKIPLHRLNSRLMNNLKGIVRSNAKISFPIE